MGLSIGLPPIIIYDDYNDASVDSALWQVEHINDVGYAQASEDSTNKFIQLRAHYNGNPTGSGTGEGRLKPQQEFIFPNGMAYIRLYGYIDVLTGNNGTITSSFGYVDTSNNYVNIWGISAGGSGPFTATIYGYVWAYYDADNNLIRYWALDNSGNVSETTLTPTNFRNFAVRITWGQDWSYDFDVRAQIFRIYETVW